MCLPKYNPLPDPITPLKIISRSHVNIHPLKIYPDNRDTIHVSIYPYHYSSPQLVVLHVVPSTTSTCSSLLEFPSCSLPPTHCHLWLALRHMFPRILLITQCNRWLNSHCSPILLEVLVAFSFVLFILCAGVIPIISSIRWSAILMLDDTLYMYIL